MKAIQPTIEPDKAVVFNCKFPIETMFHTDFIAYSTIPTIEKLKELDLAGYHIYMDNYHALKEDIKTLDFVQYLAITGSDNQ